MGRTFPKPRLRRAALRRGRDVVLPLLAALAACAHRPVSRPGLDVHVPEHPAVVAPGPEVPERVAALAGAWEGAWSGGSPSVLVVLRLGAEDARVLLANDSHADRGRIPWHTWARARVLSAPGPRLEWAQDGGASFSFVLDEEGRHLRGAYRGDGESEEVVMKRRPVEMIPASQVPRPFVCPSLEETLRRIEAERDPAARRSLVDALVARARAAGTPLVGPGTRSGLGCATFLYRGEAREVALAGDMTGWSAEKEYLERVEGTDLFFLSREFPLDTRLDYKLLPDGKWMLDPLNPRTMTGGYGPNSELAMPRYVAPGEVERDPAVPRGSVEALALESRRPGHARRASVYLPPGYAAGDRRLPVLYLHDGQDWLDYAKLDVILDNLIARDAIPPVIAVLVPPVDRRAEYSMTPEFEAFFVEEVVPAVDARYRTRRSPESRTVGGISAGGVAALSLALRHPEVFGKCIAQSTASWGKLEALRDLVRSSPGRPSAVYLDVGRFEGEFAGSDLVRFSRGLRDDLAARGVEVRYQEVNEGHSWGNWRARMRDALPFVLGRPAP